MAASKVRDYYKSVRRVISALNSNVTVKQLLDTVTRRIAQSMESGASLFLLDSTREKLIRSSSWRVPQSYIKKGLLDAEKSLSEIFTGQPVIITDITHDKHIQYPEMAIKAGFSSILGVPIIINEQSIGSIRVYSKESTGFGKEEINFVSAMANLAAAGLHRQMLSENRQQIITDQLQPLPISTQQIGKVTFAHPSEEEFAHILDFYGIEWVYEPRSFPLRWDDTKITEMFTPDFYLPHLDLYVELTTMKQKSVTGKNRKVRRLRELYPEIKITLLYKNDFDRLLAKYKLGPLAQSKGEGVSDVLYSSAKIQQRVREMAEQISGDYDDKHPVLIGVLRGVLCFFADLIRQISIPINIEFMAISYYSGSERSSVKVTRDIDIDIAGRHVIMIEDIVDTGMTLNYMLNYLRMKKPASLTVCTLLNKKARRLIDLPLNYIGFEIPDIFVVGYGLDYRENYRNLPFIGVLGTDIKSKVSGIKKPSR